MTAEGLQTVRTEMLPAGAAGRVALVTIDNPPVNAGSRQMRGDLLQAIEALRGDDALDGVVLTGANGNFVAGADIREFDRPAQEPHLPDVIAAIETLQVPVVAAIDGAALGGGYELALGCDARVATPKSVVGLPEVTLGLIPGAGGTQRLPRLTGVAAAIPLITSGRRVKAQEALDLGMIDAVAEGDLVAAALAHLATMAGRKAVLKDRPVREDAPGAIAAAEDAALKRGKGADAVAEAIEATKSAVALPVDEALKAERERSLRLRVGPQSKALRHLFFAERAASRPPEGAEPRRIGRVGVVGAGRMGLHIAVAFAGRGIAVRLAESDDRALARAMDELATVAEDLAARGRVASAGELTGRIAVGELSDMADCDLVVEAITEDMGAKKALFVELDGIVGPDAILASNTSHLDIDGIAAATARPERVGGLHFFNPAHVMRLVEVIRGARTSDETLATLLALSKRLGKAPVVARVSEGFIGNRIFSAYRRQCEFLIEDGAFPEDVDRAMREFGMATGPFASAEKGIVRREISDEEIRERLLAAMVYEAAWVLADGIAARPSDIDLVLVNGYGFPALKGGPLFWASQEPREKILRMVEQLAEASGQGVSPAPNLAAMLDRAATVG